MSTDPQQQGSFLGRALVVVAIFAAAAGIWFGMEFFADEPSRHPSAIALKAGTLLPQPKPLQPFALTDQDGSPFSLDDLRGRWTFVSFGYTSCPDVCPTIMATFNALDGLLRADTAEPPADFLFVSVDPERDPPERLSQYVRYFNPSFLGATGEHDALRALTSQLGILYARVDNQDSAMGYLVDHSASILLIDPQSRLAAIFSTPHDPKAMAEDFAAITADFDHDP
ncbi:MAG: SCO family protein [Pseudomonadota bacterium]|nr:SCO family protein [Pseudomonadota bacterium]